MLLCFFDYSPEMDEHISEIPPSFVPFARIVNETCGHRAFSIFSRIIFGQFVDHEENYFDQRNQKHAQLERFARVLIFELLIDLVFSSPLFLGQDESAVVVDVSAEILAIFRIPHGSDELFVLQFPVVVLVGHFVDALNEIGW